MTDLDLLSDYEKIKEPFFTKRRFKHADLVKLLEKFSFEKEVVGQSFEGRDIYKVKLGSGKTEVLLWSQMHGNEATATMAIVDILNYFQETSNGFVEDILNGLTLHLVPMLNPDGAERFIRRTAQQIDMNRDALALVCPESKLLKKLQEDIKPAFSFNLHDQNVRYSAGATKNQAAISFLATAYNEATEWNENRTKAMQVICEMNAVLQQIIPDKVGRFSDEFEPRAFGDNIQKWGSSLILIESGGYGTDHEKMYLRKLNFLIILKALESINVGAYKTKNLADYSAIPTNQKYLFDLLIRNVNMEGETVDIGINKDEVNIEKATDFEFNSIVEDIGDLSTFWGIETFDATGYTLSPLSDFLEILTSFKVKKEDLGRLEFEKKANFALTKNGELCHLVLNGEFVAVPS
ncbi:M14 family zinc carboxypeptidase [Arcticibacterium luteifluviistationis]|uniref:M14 family zinc carboxypeptidase n=1 Tax=Arcticibacterium luteifluviistationis TaxID=1784714 RepID=UPI001E45DCBF|nr:M14 family zinc carboxypeptidase [Arcticibacterium luteifluviistationis]